MPSFELLSFASADELAGAAAGAWLDEVEAASHAGRRYCAALSGGRMARQFFAATAQQGKARAVSFAHVHFFWADERCVPPDDSESNFKLADDLLFTPLKISKNQIHRLRGEIPPADAIAIADAELGQFVPSDEDRQPVFDLVLLGLGEDGHVASLFPNRPADREQGAAAFLAVADSPKPPSRRISLSYGALQAAKKVWVLASGLGKEKVLRESLIPQGQTPLARVIQSRSSQSAVKIYSDLKLP